MVSAPEDAEQGDSIQVEGTSLVPKNNITPTPENTIVKGKYDPLTGTLTLTNANNTISTIEGFPTAMSLGQGKKGNRGRLGPDGKPGRNGKEGRDGGQGCPGKKGDKGELGATGHKGETGDEGPEGQIGPIGIEGKQGLKGDPAEEPLLVPGNPAYEIVRSTNRVMAWGNYEALESTAAYGSHKADIIFPDANLTSADNMSFLAFFTDGSTVQAQEYYIEDLSIEKCILSLPASYNGTELDAPWKFAWFLIGY